MTAYAARWEPSPGQGMNAELSTGTPDEATTRRGRRAARVPVVLGAGLRQRGASGISVQILDLSTDGFRVSSHLLLEPGTDVWLRLPGLEPCPARVKWREHNFIGCAFHRPLHPAVLDLVVKRADGR